MNIVIDTKVVISGTFFGGFPRRVLEAVVDRTLSAYATTEIVDEYTEVVQEMIDRKQGHLSVTVLSPFVHSLHLVETVTSVEVSRDPDDDKFIGCAIDSKSYYIVSGDKDLLVLQKYKDIEIITASEFCRRFL
ncbi:MAG: putative toxin-antitoxin system toxin component, PIN family [Flexilinea sp.]|nr:putative toxin-antitoxin system toxin component, PIN family [Flexilinea sp.]